MAQVTKGKNHSISEFNFDSADVLVFPAVTITANQAITAVQQAIALPCSYKIWGAAVGTTAAAANNPTLFDIRLNSTTFVAIPAASATQINGESDLSQFEQFPITNRTVTIFNGGFPTNITYQPLMVTGNSFGNISAGVTVTGTPATAQTTTYQAANPEMIWQKGNIMLLSYVSGATVGGLLSVVLFGKAYDIRRDQPNIASAGGADIVLSYTNDIT